MFNKPHAVVLALGLLVAATPAAADEPLLLRIQLAGAVSGNYLDGCDDDTALSSFWRWATCPKTIILPSDQPETTMQLPGGSGSLGSEPIDLQSHQIVAVAPRHRALHTELFFPSSHAWVSGDKFSAEGSDAAECCIVDGGDGGWTLYNHPTSADGTCPSTCTSLSNCPTGLYQVRRVPVTPR